MAWLSVIIYDHGDTQQFENTLASVLQNMPEDSELIAVTRGDYEDPYGIGDDVQFVAAAEKTRLTDALNSAIKASAGEIVHFLRAGYEVEENWTDSVDEHFDDFEVGSVSPLIISSEDKTLLASGLRYGAGGARKIADGGQKIENAGRRPIVAPTLSAGFFRRSALDEAGGLQNVVGDSLADIDLGMTLKALGYTCVCDQESRVRTSSLEETKQSFMHGLRTQRLFMRHAPSVGWLIALICHPWSVMLQSIDAIPSLGAITHLLGRPWACIEFWSYRSFHQSLKTTNEKPRLKIQDTQGKQNDPMQNDPMQNDDVADDFEFGDDTEHRRAA
ncbi:MAG: cellulose synthase/poly-beta-1,6-N-acetylglucosamine synthase-like glycosyltransferase [Pirellulaceae bacterium]